MYYSAISLLAALILLIEHYDLLFHFRAAYDKPVWEVYARFLAAVLVYYVTDILWGVLEGQKLRILLFADTTVYFIAMGAGVLFWARFTVAYTEEKSGFGTFLVYAGRLVAGLITLFTLVNLFAPVLFTVDGDCVYRALPLRYVLLGAQILLLLLISAYSFSRLRIHTNGRGRHRTVALFGLIMAAFLFAQLLFPYLPLYAMAYLLGTCLLHTFVLNEEKEEYRRSLEEAGKVRELQATILSLLDNMPAMTFTKDAETGVYLACNQAFADYAHKEKPGDAVGHTDAELFDPETAKHFVEEDKVALSMEEPYIFFEEVLDALGNPRRLQTTKQRYYNFQGRLCVLGMCQDVTDHLRIEREKATTKEAYENARNTGIIYNHLSQALARGYLVLYYVNLDSEEYIKYRNEEASGTLEEEERGYHFFEQCRTVAERLVHPDDREDVVKALRRKTLVAALDQNKTFVMTFRYRKAGESRYITLRATRLEDDEHFITMGLSDVDETMQHRRAAMRAKEEQIAYARLNSLTGDFLCVYVVVPETGRYREFSASEHFERFGIEKEGADFFRTTAKNAPACIFSQDLNRFLAAFTRENILAEIGRRGIFTLSYRLVIEDRPVYVQLKAALVEEEDGTRLIVGINDIDAQVRQEEEYVRHMAEARLTASIDPLTGVKNRHAYLEAEERLNQQIAEGHAPEFAVVILDVNDLKKVNDTAGHNAGDQLLRDACRVICNIFKHSPVFRVGGDEFAVIVQGQDYLGIDELIMQMSRYNSNALQSGGIVIACGMAEYGEDDSVAPVFERADQNMYENKSDLKARKAVR